MKKDQLPSERKLSWLSLLWAAFVLAFSLLLLAAMVEQYVNIEGHALIFLSCLITLVIVFIYVFLLKYIPRQSVLLAVMFGIAFALRLLWVAQAPTEPVSDFLHTMQYARAAMEGDFSWTATPLGSLYTFYSAFLGLFGTVFGLTVFTVGILNALLHSATCILVFFIVLELMHDKPTALAACAFCTFFPHQLLYNSVMSNQIPASFLGWLGIYFLVKITNRPRLWLGVCAGLCFALAAVIRTDMAVILYALILYTLGLLIMGIIRTLKEKASRVGWHKTIEWRRVFACLLACLAFFLFKEAIYGIARISGVHQYNGKDGNSLYYQVAVGQKVDTYGLSGPEDSEALFDLLPEEADRYFAQMIKDSLCNPDFLKMHVGKFRLAWTRPYTEWIFSAGSKTFEDPTFLNNLLRFNDGMYMMMAVLSVFAAFVLYRQPRHKATNYLAICLGGYVAMLILVVRNARYKYFSQMILFVFAAIGAAFLQKWLKKLPPYQKAMMWLNAGMNRVWRRKI